MCPVWHCNHLIGEERVGWFSFHGFSYIYTVCHSLFALPLGVIGRLCSVIVVLPGHILYCLTKLIECHMFLWVFTLFKHDLCCLTILSIIHVKEIQCVEDEEMCSLLVILKVLSRSVADGIPILILLFFQRK